MIVNLKSFPKANPTYSVEFPRLSGGVNWWELDYRLKPDESPYMENLWWQDGVLQSRDGQVYLGESLDIGTAFTAHGYPFHGKAFFHVGQSIVMCDVKTAPYTQSVIYTGLPLNRGTFFRYQDGLFYKNRGGFVKITYDSGADTFSVSRVEDNAYVPVTVINAAPATGSGTTYQPENRLSPDKTVWYSPDAVVQTYKLPVNATSVVKITVGGVEQVPGTDFHYSASYVTFVSGHEPATGTNNVAITYRLANDIAYNAVMDCPYAYVAGGDQHLCILLGGCTAQPNAVFWNSNDNLSMNAAYWPMSYYNLVGDSSDPVTGFGSQYSTIVVFKERSLGKLGYSVQTVDGRDSISFTYTPVNERWGCDLPWTIQVVDNNLVFCNTQQGVFMLREASAAYENNVVQLSKKINGDSDRGLLKDVRHEDTVVTSFDDHDRYWLIAGGHAYVWDYQLSTYTDPSWFYFTGINGVSFFHDDAHDRFHIDAAGRVTQLKRVFSDYDGAIRKTYQFPVQHMGTYDRLKNVLSILVAVRSDTDSYIHIRYDTDWESRDDLTDIMAYSWHLSPRNLKHRFLGVDRYAFTVRRRPMCRHVQHFGMTFSNEEIGCDMAIVSAQMFYNYQGEER